MRESQRTFVPAAGQHWLLPLYDPVTRLLGADKARKALLEQAELRPGHRVLEVGCGTGTLTVLIKQRQPGVEVVGLDPDSTALARAKRKAERAGVSVQLDRGFSDPLSYPDATFDRVFSCFMFHHLEGAEKAKSLAEIRRVLKAGGRLEMLDFGGPGSDAHGSWARLFHAQDRFRDNSENRILALMTEAAFPSPKIVGHRSIVLGRVAYYQASVPFEGGAA